MKKCKYRNCCEYIVNGRVDKVFCNRSCKRMEQTYRKRALKKLNKNEEIK
jgi:hypothetical protein